MKIYNILFALLIGFFMISCGDDPDPEPTPESCDTTDITYTNGAAAIINASCATANCHHNEATAPSFPMSDYDQSFVAAGLKEIVGAINHTEGLSAMPIGEKLAQCDIDILTAWIDGGALE